MLKIIRDDVEIEIGEKLPVLPLKDVIIFPHMIFPLLVGREQSLRAIQSAMVHDKMIFLASQKNPTLEEPSRSELYRVGVIARILQVIKLPNGLLKVLVEGLVRGRVVRFFPVTDYFEGTIEIFPEKEIRGAETKALTRKLQRLFKGFVNINTHIPSEALLSVEHFHSANRLVCFIAGHIPRELAFKQQLLEQMNVKRQLTMLIEHLHRELEILEFEKGIDEKVRDRVGKGHRTFYLQEQMRAIQEELGENSSGINEAKALHEKIIAARMPAEACEKALEELNKLQNMQPLSPESSVIRNYIEWLLAVPWVEKTTDTLGIVKAQKILDQDHFGLKEPKERILEHLAVLKLVRKLKGPILCFVGPPGVGKTSLARSIARAMGRKFVRASLGGVRDEAEIRGHRRTYIGSMPGRIMQSMKKAKTINPVFLLDEIDKLGADFRGDPSSALLEVLDPEQNKAFNDNYLEVDYDLSQVLFVTTANVQSQIPEPLQDRMEIIEIPGYLEHEKVQIARRHLIPQQIKDHGLGQHRVSFTRQGIETIIRDYTREAGVRNLDKNISRVCRKIAKHIANAKSDFRVSRIGKNKVGAFLGIAKYRSRNFGGRQEAGISTGLAWTRYGGELLKIEVNVVPGKGNLMLTGKLGDVMKESAHAAMSYIRLRASELKIEGKFWKENDIHVHIPEGAIPKDGPSAGITIAISIISALLNRPIAGNLAMTGEITLRGNVLAIGGLNEKILAAQRHGLKTVLVPDENEKEIEELPEEVRKGLDIVQVSHMDQVVDAVFNGKACKIP